MATSMSDSDFQKHMSEALRDGLTKEAEPLIQKCLVETEKVLRAKIAAAVAGMMERSYSYERDGGIVSIRVNLGELK